MDNLDIQQIFKNLNLTEIQKHLIKILYDADGYVLGITRYRDKFKTLKLDRKHNMLFQKYLKQLEQKGIILIAYDEDGKRFATLYVDSINEILRNINNSEINMENEIEAAVAESESSYSAEGNLSIEKIPDFLNLPTDSFLIKNRTKKRTRKEMEDIKEYVFRRIQTSDGGKGIKKKMLYKEIFEAYPNLATMSITRITRELVADKKIYFTKAKGVIWFIASKAELKPELDCTRDIMVQFSAEDYEMMQKSMSDLGIDGTPKEWLTKIVELAATNIAHKYVIYNKFAFNEEIWNQYVVVEKDMHKRDHNDIDSVIHRMCINYIKAEYNERYIYANMQNIVDTVNSSDDPKILRQLRKFIDSRITKLSS
jgi:hypothetical protein